MECVMEEILLVLLYGSSQQIHSHVLAGKWIYGCMASCHCLHNGLYNTVCFLVSREAMTSAMSESAQGNKEKREAQAAARKEVKENWQAERNKKIASMIAGYLPHSEKWIILEARPWNIAIQAERHLQKEQYSVAWQWNLRNCWRSMCHGLSPNIYMWLGTHCQLLELVHPLLYFSWKMLAWAFCRGSSWTLEEQKEMMDAMKPQAEELVTDDGMDRTVEHPVMRLLPLGQDRDGCLFWKLPSNAIFTGLRKCTKSLALPTVWASLLLPFFGS